MKSSVYFSKIHSGDTADRIRSLRRLLDTIGPQIKIRQGEIVPIKITIGDESCVYHVAPELVKPIVAFVKGKQGKPFLFDTNVIYKGSRQNAVDHMALAEKKRFTCAEVDAPFIVADGLFGSDGREYAVTGAKFLKKVKIPSFVGALDSLIVVSHATGHLLSGYAAAIKNVAMGMASRPTKQIQHSSVKPRIIESRCVACGLCREICPVSAISLTATASINGAVCIGCGECLCACKFDAISVNFQEDAAIFCYRMVECAKFITSRFKNTVYFTFAIDITKDCDCISPADKSAIFCKDLGIFASTDIVAIDQAVLDLITERHGDIFSKAWNTGVHHAMLEYAKKLTLGNSEYSLIEV